MTNPLEAVTENLVNGADVALFRVNADEPSYWRVTTLAELDGRTFQLPTSDLTRFEEPATSDPGGRIQQEVQIQALSGRLIPAAATPAQIEPASDFHFDPESETLMKGSDLTPGDQFTVVSEAHDVTLDEMRSATTDDPPRSLYLALHDSVDDTVYDLAAGATASAPTDADKMIALTVDQPDEISDALAKLSARQQLALRYYADLPDAEIASAIGARPSTVRSLIRRALIALQKEPAT